MDLEGVMKRVSMRGPVFQMQKTNKQTKKQINKQKTHSFLNL